MDALSDILTKLHNRAVTSASDSIIVVRGGDVLFSHQIGDDFPLLDTMSITKSVVALCYGVAFRMGFLTDLDVPLHTYFPVWQKTGYDTITLRHILNHTSGLYNDPSASDIYGATRTLDLALNADLTQTPGTVFSYNNKAMAILAALIEIVSGLPLDQFARKFLLHPMGIQDFMWRADESGLPHALAGLRLRAPDLITLGRFVLAKGFLAGQPYLDPSFFRAMLTPTLVSTYRCGLLWWIDDRAQRIAAQGFFGQWLLIYPESGVIGVRQLAKEKTTPDGADFFHDFKNLTRQISGLY